MSRPISGGCACGAVRYELSGAVELAFHCYCRKCQRATGGGHASIIGLPLESVALTGEIRHFEQTADNGAVTSAGFCPACGSPVLSSSARFPDRLYFHAATLDDPAFFHPTFAVFQDAAQPWDPVDPRLQDGTG